MNKQKVLYPYSGILFGNSKEWSADTCYNMEPWKHAKWKKAAIPALAGSFFTTKPPGKPIHTHTHKHTHICIYAYCSEKALATHSNSLAWKIPWTEEPGSLQSMGSLRVGHHWATSLILFPFMNWRRKWQPTPDFLPGECQGWGSVVGCHLWGHTESDKTEAT